MNLVQAVAQAVLDVLYVWAFIIALFIIFAVAVERGRVHREKQRQLSRKERHARFELERLRMEAGHRQEIRVLGGARRGPEVPR